MSTDTAQLTCEICGTPLSYSGRGRPPKRCDEHKKSAAPSNGNKTEGEKPEMATQTRPRPRPGGSTQQQAPAPRPRPGQKSAQQVSGDEAHSPGSDSATKLPPVGKSDSGSRTKAETSAKRANAQADELVAWPTNTNGKPLARIIFSASELVPTGQYANVSIGPAQVTAFVDLDRELGENEGYFHSGERDVLVRAINELAEVVERDIIAVQRNMVLESMQEQLATP